MKRARNIVFGTLLASVVVCADEGIVFEANVKSVDKNHIYVVSQGEETALLKAKLPKDLVKKLQTKVGEKNRTRFMAPMRAIASMKPRPPQKVDLDDINNKDR